MPQAGPIISSKNLSRIDNAFVEEVVCTQNNQGYIIVSYSVRERNGSASVQKLRLNINQNTVLLNSFSRRICSCCLRRGMWINAVFSSRMTRSIPPQAAAFLITVQGNTQPESDTTVGRIILVDFDSRFFITEDPDNVRSQMKFIVTNTTQYTNQFGLPVRFEALEPGQLVRVTHANFQTASIPPQTTAFRVRIL